MKEELKNQKAITLIALIITIIVLLILAMVSIKLVWDGGIISHAKTAVDKYGKAQQNEIDQINAAFGNNENQNNAPDELIEYVLGKDLKGQPLSNLAMMNEKGIVFNKLNGENVEFLNFGEYTENNKTLVTTFLYIKYKDKAYSILCNNNDFSHFDLNKTKSVNLVYEPKGKEGQKIEYSIDGTEENKKEWTILYDNGDNIEIVSPNSMGSLTLGENDEQTAGNNGFEKTVNSYNNAIERINAYASSFVTNSNKIDVRSVGSNPSNKDSRNTDKYTSEKLENCKFNYKGTEVNVNGIGEMADNNCEQDLVRMSYWQVAKTGETYWLASRLQSSDVVDEYIYFGLANLEDRGLTTFSPLWSIRPRGYSSSGFKGDANTYGSNHAVRPVVKISSEQ